MHTIDSEKFLKELQEQAYTTVPFPIERKELEEAMEGFMQYIELPDTIKSHINMTIAPAHRRGDVGYKRRNAKEDRYNDNKDFIHYHPAVLDQYAEFIAKHPVIASFFEKAQPIWQAANDVVEQSLEILDAKYPGSYDKVFTTDEHVHVLLRFLRYDWEAGGKYLAKPHFDAGSFTLPIAESCGGLRIGACPETLTPVEHASGSALFMLASNYKTVLPEDCGISPGWHDVIQVDESLIGKPFARWAIVAFVEAHGVEALTRTETHKWYKGEEDGANDGNRTHGLQSHNLAL